MKQASEPVSALDWAGRQRDHVGWLAGSALLDALVGTGMVVVVEEVVKHSLQVLLAEDQQAVEGRGYAEPDDQRFSGGSERST